MRIIEIILIIIGALNVLSFMVMVLWVVYLYKMRDRR